MRGSKKFPQKDNRGSLKHISCQTFSYFGCGRWRCGNFFTRFFKRRYTDSPLPYFDAALTSFSLVATLLTTQKILENWIFWVVIDAAYIIIYWNRSLPFTAILFFIYTFIAAYGYFKWRKKLKALAA